MLERSFHNLSGVEKFMFDKTRANNLLGKTKEMTSGQRKLKKGKLHLQLFWTGSSRRFYPG